MAVNRDMPLEAWAEAIAQSGFVADSYIEWLEEPLIPMRSKRIAEYAARYLGAWRYDRDVAKEGGLPVGAPDEHLPRYSAHGPTWWANRAKANEAALQALREAVAEYRRLEH